MGQKVALREFHISLHYSRPGPGRERMKRRDRDDRPIYLKRVTLIPEANDPAAWKAQVLRFVLKQRGAHHFYATAVSLKPSGELGYRPFIPYTPL